MVQRSLPVAPWADPALRRMPGMRPVEGSWIVVDDAYAAQSAERRRLLAERPDVVMAVTPGAEDAVAEVLEVALAALPSGFRREGGAVVTPDGRRVAVEAPLPTLNAVLQEDLLVLRPEGGEHVLVAGLLCFPASWTLAEKIGRPLTRIHQPVEGYGAVAQRVQRLFDRTRPGRPTWRMNALGYHDAALHQPRTEAAPKDASRAARFLRCERQTVVALPRTGAVLFAVHTWVVRPEALTPEQRAGCPVRFG